MSAAMKTTCDACGDKLLESRAVSKCVPEFRYICAECAAVSRPTVARSTIDEAYAWHGHVMVDIAGGPIVSHKLVAAKAKMTIDTATGRDLDTLLGAHGFHRGSAGETDANYRRRFEEEKNRKLVAVPYTVPRPITVAALTAALLELDAQPEALRACEFGGEERYRRCLSKILGRLTPAQHRAAENRASAILSVVRGCK